MLEKESTRTNVLKVSDKKANVSKNHKREYTAQSRNGREGSVGEGSRKRKRVKNSEEKVKKMLTVEG